MPYHYFRLFTLKINFFNSSLLKADRMIYLFIAHIENLQCIPLGKNVAHWAKWRKLS
jgi:hypothetical protein